MAVLTVAVPAAGQGRPETRCPPGFTPLGGFTLEEWIEVPEVQWLLEEGILTLEGIAATYERMDRNGNGVLCRQLIEPRNEHSAFWNLKVNTTDDNAAAP